MLIERTLAIGMPPCSKQWPLELSCEHVQAHKLLEGSLTIASAATTPTPLVLQLIGLADRIARFHNDRLKTLEQRDLGCLRFQAHLGESLQNSLHKGDGFGRKAMVPITRADLHFAPLDNLRQAV